jgi:hypothetical protein
MEDYLGERRGARSGNVKNWAQIVEIFLAGVLENGSKCCAWIELRMKL